MALRKCGQCQRGLAPGMAKTYDPDCPSCREKKRNGLRTGDEPMPVRTGGFRRNDVLNYNHAVKP